MLLQNDLDGLLKQSVDCYLPINTDELNVRDTGIIACDHIVKSMRKKYIDQFKLNYGIK
jgi:hypothetical protein